MKIGNRIMQTGNGIISSTPWPLIVKLLLQNGSNFYQRVLHWSWKPEIELFIFVSALR